MKGIGTDENALIEVLTNRSNAQRMEIVKAFKTAYGKDLIDEIKSETSGNFKTILVALLRPTIEYYARELYEAMAGAGTDESALFDIMCAMSNQQIRDIAAEYERLFKKNLEKALRGDTSGNFKRLMTSLSSAGRDESGTNPSAARADAQELKQAGVDKWGTDESAFNRIMCTRSYEQIKLIAQEYEKLTGRSLETDIKSEFSGDIKEGLLSILNFAQNRSQFFAERLHKSMAGLGTNDKSLIRLVVSRCEVDMADIKDEFEIKYGKSLKSFIQGDTSGDYRNTLYALIGEDRS